MNPVLILDLDGPILDGRRKHYQCYHDILVNAGAKPLSITHYWAMKRERTDVRLILKATGAESILDQFRSTWLERIEQLDYLSYDRVHSGTRQWLIRQREHGARLVLATLRHDEVNLHTQLFKLDLDRCLDDVVAVSKSGTAAAKAEAVCVRLGSNLTSCRAWIGDTEVDIEAAHILGIPAIAVTSGLRSYGYLRAFGPDALVARLADVNLELASPRRSADVPPPP